MKTIFFSIFSFLVLLACISNNRNSIPKSRINSETPLDRNFRMLGASGSATKVDYQISLGDSLTIALDSNTSTGYSWVLVNDYLISVLEAVSHDFIHENELLGSSGIEEWNFKAIKKGIDTLRFEYKRGWEEEEPIKRENIVVEVR